MQNPQKLRLLHLLDQKPETRNRELHAFDHGTVGLEFGPKKQSDSYNEYHKRDILAYVVKREGTNIGAEGIWGSRMRIRDPDHHKAKRMQFYIDGCFMYVKIRRMEAAHVSRAKTS